MTIGDVLVKLGRTDEALAEYRLAMQTGSQMPELHNSIGLALVKTGDLAGASSEFQEAITLNPHYASPHLELAKLHFASRQNTAATDELLAAFHAEPVNFHTLTAIAHYMAVNTDTNARDPQTALLMVRKAAELSANQQPDVF